MFKLAPSIPGQTTGEPKGGKPTFGVVKPAPRLESAFVFPAPERPRGLSINGSKKGAGTVSKKP